jgi:hypothetical protein
VPLLLPLPSLQALGPHAQLHPVSELPGLPAPPGAAQSAAALPSSMQEAMGQSLAAGLPTLEHNGFQLLFTGSGSSTASSPAAAEAAAEAVAREVARRCTGETNLGLGAFVKVAGSDSFSMMASPLGPLPLGRGLILVGDLDLSPRVRGKSPARTVARWLTVGVDDGRKLL